MIVPMKSSKGSETPYLDSQIIEKSNRVHIADGQIRAIVKQRVCRIEIDRSIDVDDKAVRVVLTICRAIHCQIRTILRVNHV